MSTNSETVTRTPGALMVDSHALGIWSPNTKIGGETKIFDVRGWGYLTGRGHGGLGLSVTEAKAIQRANADFLVLSWNSHDALVAALEKIIELQTVQWPAKPHWKMLETAKIARAALSKVKEPK